MQRDAIEIRNNEVTGNFLGAPFARQVLNVAECLRFSFAQILAGGFVLHQDDARPEKVNIDVVAGNLFYRLLKAGNRPAGNTKDLKNSFQKVCFSALSLFAPVQSRENLIALCRISFQEIGMN
jgi:hypothetical protein